MAHEAVLLTQRAKYKAGAAMMPGLLTVHQTKLLWQPVQGVSARPQEIAIADITRAYLPCLTPVGRPATPPGYEASLQLLSDHCPVSPHPNSPTAQQPNSPTAQQPNSPTAQQQPNSPTTAPAAAENQKAKNTGKMRIATALGSHIFEFDTEDDATSVSQLLASLRAAPVACAAPAAAQAQAGGSHAGDLPAAQKEHLLKDNPDLRAMHDALVRSGLLSEPEFWSGQRDAAARQHSSQQRPGMSNVMSSIVSAVADGKQNQVAYTLTREAIAAILAESPAVRRAYLANVPHTMSEERFWSYYCKHQYALHEKRRLRLQGKRAHGVDDEHAGVWRRGRCVACSGAVGCGLQVMG
jgi:hypothetical protein